MENNRIYCDNAATTYISSEVLNEMLPVLTNVYGNASSIHSFGMEAHKLVENARGKIADAIKCKPNEIYFTSGGTESNNMALLGIANAYVKRGKHIMVSSIEHPSVINTARKLEDDGFEVTYLKVDPNGLLDISDLLHHIKPTTTLISVMMANNEVGTIQNIKAISKICEENNIVLHTDAVQALGHVAIDVKQMGIDAMSMSSHKLHGPKGVGALYIRKGIKFNKLMFGGEQEQGKRPGTYNTPAIVGFGKAVEVATRDLTINNKKLKYMREQFIRRVFDKIDGVKLNGHPIQRLASNVNLSFEAVEGESIMLGLDKFGIAVSTGSACNSKSLEKSHVLDAMGVDNKLINGSVRFSFGNNITIEQIDYIVECLEKVIAKLRAYSPLKVSNKRKNK